MGLLERLRQLIASNVNALFDSLTDPGAAIDELIANMEAAAREARDEVKAALTEEKRAQRHRETTHKSIAEWGARAARAVTAGDDALAREALSQQQLLKEEVERLDAEAHKSQLEMAELERGLRELDVKIRVVKARKETLKEVMRARARGSAVDRYEQMVTDVEVKEAEVQLGEELGDREHSQSTVEVRRKIEKLESDREVEARLAALKSKMRSP